MKAILLFSVLFGFTMAQAGELYDITMPESDTVNGKTLVLNGMGYKEVSVLGILIKIYVGGLYLEKKSANADEILNSKSVKQVRCTFKHRVTANDFKKAWPEAFDRTCKGDCKTKHHENFEKFNNFFTKTISSGENLYYNFSPAGLEVYMGTEKLGSIPDAEFGKVILSAWIGPSGPAQFKTFLAAK